MGKKTKTKKKPWQFLHYVKRKGEVFTGIEPTAPQGALFQ
jgi:hypothetical protein